MVCLSSVLNHSRSRNEHGNVHGYARDAVKQVELGVELTPNPKSGRS